MKLEIIDNFEKFLTLESVWNGLLKQSAADNPFSTFEWCRAWLEVFGRDIELLILVIKDESGIKGIAPFCIKVKKIITFIGYPQNDYAGLIFGKDSSGIPDLIAQYLSENKGKWNKVILDQFAEECSQIEGMGEALKKYGLPWRSEPSDSCPAMLLTDRDAAKKMYYKRNITSYINWFKKEGEFRYNIYTESEEAVQRLDDLFAQHIYRWKGTSTPSYFSDEKMKEFYRTFMKYLNPRGWVQFSSLTLADKFLALYISFEYDNILYLYKTCYNPDYAKKSPGQVILRYLFDYALEKNIVEMDFARGDEGYKERFANAIKKNCRLIVYKSGMSKMAAETFHDFRYSKFVDIVYRNKIVRGMKRRMQKLMTGSPEKSGLTPK